MTHVCFVLQSIDAVIDPEDALSLYDAAYKVLGALLYSHPNIRMSLAMNGKMLEYLAASRAEFLCLLREFTARTQVEVIGGGYYDPAFPLLLPRERTAQIDMLTAAITQETGKRPHTAMLYASAFSDSLVSVLKSNGIDCVLLDSGIVSRAGKKDLMGIPLVMSDRGKSVDIFPIFPLQQAAEIIKGTGREGADVTAGAGVAVTKGTNGTDAKSADTVCTFCYTPQDMAGALSDGSFLRMAEAVIAESDAKLSTIAEARAAVRRRVRAYIASGIARSMGGEAESIQEYLQSHPAGDDLYHRQTLVSILIEQYHGDKARKKAARECLLSSQCGGYLFGGRADAAYQMLNRAESQILSPRDAMSETVTALDINEDGTDEYVCRMGCHTSVISRCGAVVSFDATAGRGLHRYSRCLFCDYFAPSSGAKSSLASYTLQKFLRGRREVFFSGKAAIGTQVISIRKKYIVTSNGFAVQYIIRNEGEGTFASRFFVRFGFLHVDDQVKSVALGSDGGGVSTVRLTDNDGGASFLIEPNEYAALDVSKPAPPVRCNLPTNVTLSWQINIDAGMECEKTVSLSMLVKDDGTAEAGQDTVSPVERATGQLNLWE